MDEKEKAIDGLCSSQLIYEVPLARAVFGSNPSATELYATHLFLYSQSNRFGRSHFFRICSDLGGGPYFLRPQTDLDLLNNFYDLKLDDSEDISSNETIRAIAKKCATLDWQDKIENPFVNSLKSIGSPLKDQNHAVHFLGHDLKEIDLARERSGLDFGNIKPVIDPQTEIAECDYSDRKLFHHPAYAIDPEHTVEVDDAIGIEKLEGKEWLHVHVADPARLFNIDSAIMSHCMHRVSSMYFPDCRYPMMPDAISHMASLGSNKNISSKTITFSALIDEKTGDISNYSVNLGLVSNIQRMTYSLADDALSLLSGENLSHLTSHDELSFQNSDSNVNFDANNKKTIEDLGRISNLCQKHSEYRKRMGCLNYSLPQMNVVVRRNTGIISVTPRVEKKSAKVVSECMIIAGRIASLFAIDSGLEAPFRYQELGENMSRTLHKDSSTYEILRSLKDLNSSAVDILPRPHQAMGIQSYCRSTSPLRRAFDLILHQQIHGILKCQKNSVKNIHRAIHPMYTHEQLIKRLSKQSERFWIHRYLEQELSKKPFIPVTCIKLESDYPTDSIYYVKDFAVYSYGLVPGTSNLSPGTEFPCQIIAVDPFRGALDIRIP